jgi:hypothetical protein
MESGHNDRLLFANRRSADILRGRNHTPESLNDCLRPYETKYRPASQKTEDGFLIGYRPFVAVFFSVPMSHDGRLLPYDEWNLVGSSRHNPDALQFDGEISHTDRIPFLLWTSGSSFYLALKCSPE